MTLTGSTTVDAIDRQPTVATSLIQLRDQVVPRSYTQHHPVLLEQARGAWLIDTDGQRYLDFAGGIGVLNVGNTHPAIVAAVQAQAGRFMHSGPVMLHEGYIRLAARLAALLPGASQNQVLLVNSGAEAVENAVKVARYATGRSAIIAFGRSFHGRTFLTSTLTGKAWPYKAQPGSAAPDVYHAPYPYSFRPPAGVALDRVVEHCLDSLEFLLATAIGPGKLAAVIVEVVQGEGGFVVSPPEFMPALQAFCRRAGALMIVDEIQSGYGRTGRFFAFEHFDVQPDVVTAGKSMGAGLPLAAVIARRELFDAVPRGDIGGTYGGNPVACAAALAVLDVMDEEDLVRRAAALGTRARHLLELTTARHEEVGEIRGLGPMLAIELVTDRATRAPATDLTARVLARARELGLILIKSGPYDNVIRILPPLTITDDELAIGMAALGRALDECCAGGGTPAT